MVSRRFVFVSLQSVRMVRDGLGPVCADELLARVVCGDGLFVRNMHAFWAHKPCMLCPQTHAYVTHP